MGAGMQYCLFNRAPKPGNGQRIKELLYSGLMKCWVIGIGYQLFIEQKK
jgi:hypothetical protein